MKGPTLILSAIALIIGGLALVGCATLIGTASHSAAAAPPTATPLLKATKASQARSNTNALADAACTIPTGWVAYQVQTNETVFSVAARAGITAADVLTANCLTTITQIEAGSWIAVPPSALITQPSTILPLGISAFVADAGQANANQAQAGNPVTLLWHAQGPVVAVRIGWLYEGQFIEEAINLPAVGAWTLTAPDDGRSQITYMVRVSDGLHEVAAQTTVQIACTEGWFFAPAPSGCPSPAVITTFYEQFFERGSIVYIPALRVHYVLIQNQPGQPVSDSFVPGMPLRDPALDGAIPAGLDQPRGAIHYAWRSDEAIMTGLGYATRPARAYTGMLQRVIGGETVYFASSTGPIYHFIDGQAWRAVIAQ
ncbi:MAG: LysM peptidoglycan-binding domain-containing protein [Anaerolineae bacterium]|nr:LysM peptidoglycan-binding domain-containing protein [Anaerolineae bacterium]